MPTRRSKKPVQALRIVDPSSPIDGFGSPTDDRGRSTDLTMSMSTPSITQTDDSYPSSAPTIDNHFDVQPRGREAVAAFPNNIVNINSADYT